MIIQWSSNVSNFIDHQNSAIPNPFGATKFRKSLVSGASKRNLSNQVVAQFSRRHHKGMADSRSTPTSYMASSQTANHPHNSGGLESFIAVYCHILILITGFLVIHYIGWIWVSISLPDLSLGYFNPITASNPPASTSRSILPGI